MGGWGYGGGGRGRVYTYRYTVTTRMTPSLRWAATRDILVSFIVGIKSQDNVHRPQLLKRKQSRSRFEPRSLCLLAYRLTARPNRLTSLRSLPGRAIRRYPPPPPPVQSPLPPSLVPSTPHVVCVHVNNTVHSLWVNFQFDSCGVPMLPKL